MVFVTVVAQLQRLLGPVLYADQVVELVTAATRPHRLRPANRLQTHQTDVASMIAQSRLNPVNCNRQHVGYHWEY